MFINLKSISLSVFLLASFSLSGAVVQDDGNIVRTVGDDTNQKVEIYYKPGWITNTLYKDGMWIGNPDLDNLPSNIRIVAQITTPQNTYASISASQVRNIVKAALGDENFATDEPLNAESVLPFLHVSLVVMPLDLNYVVHCSLRLLEAVKLERNSWSKDFQWQAITWQDEKMFFTRRGKIDDDTINAIGEMVGEFKKQYMTDKVATQNMQSDIEKIKSELESGFDSYEKEKNEELSSKVTVIERDNVNESVKAGDISENKDE